MCIYELSRFVSDSMWLYVTVWTVAHQGPLSMEFSRQEYWSGLQFPTPEDLADSGIEPVSLAFPALAGRFLTITTSHFPLFDNQVFTSRQENEETWQAQERQPRILKLEVSYDLSMMKLTDDKAYALTQCSNYILVPYPQMPTDKSRTFKHL